MSKSNKEIIKLDPDIQEKLILSLKKYMLQEFDLDLGNFPAQFLLDHILKEFSPHIYNQALSDVHQWLSERFLYLADDVFVLTKDEAPPSPRK